MTVDTLLARIEAELRRLNSVLDRMSRRLWTDGSVLVVLLSYASSTYYIREYR